MNAPSQSLHPAATVVVVRDGTSPDGGPSVETLMLRRNDRGAFGGMWVFPGGRVDDDDVDPAAPDDEHGRRSSCRGPGGRRGGGARARSGDAGRAVPLAPAVVAPKGFATWFFVAAGSDAEVEVDGAEIHEHAWLTPVEVLRRQQAGEVRLAPPTFVTLTVLAEHATVAELLEALRADTPERFHTQLGLDGEVNTAFWHGDEAYDAAPGPAGSRHRLTMADGGWSYVRSPSTAGRA